MYPGEHARLRRDQPAVIMAGSGKVLTYGEGTVNLSHPVS
jgi:hypothetical protein